MDRIRAANALPILIPWQTLFVAMSLHRQQVEGIDAYRGQRSAAAERFIDTVKRVGLEPFKAAANAVRRATAVHS